MLQNILLMKDIKDIMGKYRKWQPILFRHSINVAKLVEKMGVQESYPNDILYSMIVGALLHDIGKLKIPRTCLNKKDDLNTTEWEVVKQHPLLGLSLLPSWCSSLTRTIVQDHHEKLDGSGYPNGKKHDQIDETVRLVIIADMYDAMINTRSYKTKYSEYTTMKILREEVKKGRICKSSLEKLNNVLNQSLAVSGDK